DAINRRADFWPRRELVIYRRGGRVGWIWDLSRTVSAFQFLGRPGETIQALPRHRPLGSHSFFGLALPCHARPVRNIPLHCLFDALRAHPFATRRIHRHAVSPLSEMSNGQRILRRVRVVTIIFIFGLVVSGATAIPLLSE